MDKKKKLIFILLAILPTLITMIVLMFVPELVSSTYDANGVIVSLGTKYQSLMIPVLIIVMGIFWYFSFRYFNIKANEAKTDDSKKMHQRSCGIIYSSAVGTMTLFCVIQIIYLITLF